jgi:hypothetical protein
LLSVLTWICIVSPHRCLDRVLFYELKIKTNKLGMSSILTGYEY